MSHFFFLHVISLSASSFYPQFYFLPSQMVPGFAQVSRYGEGRPLNPPALVLGPEVFCQEPPEFWGELVPVTEVCFSPQQFSCPVALDVEKT